MTPRLLLVPYEERHVPLYHEWMKDPVCRSRVMRSHRRQQVLTSHQAIQQATASEPLSLVEEYENQQSWRTSPDKLTFIICHIPESPAREGLLAVVAGADDAPEGMVGDINLFLTQSDDDDDDTPLPLVIWHGESIERSPILPSMVKLCDTNYIE